MKRPFAVRYAAFLATLIRNRPVVWVDVETGEEEAEQWTRRAKHRSLRPRCYGLINNLPCGCSRRLGRMVMFNAACVEHMGDLAFGDPR